MDEYANKEKYERAKAEAHVNGTDAHDIYIRLGGKVVDSGSQPVEKPVAKKKTAKKK